MRICEFAVTSGRAVTPDADFEWCQAHLLIQVYPEGGGGGICLLSFFLMKHKLICEGLERALMSMHRDCFAENVPNQFLTLIPAFLVMDCTFI